MDTKICRNCGIEKPISEFYKNRCKCKSCMLAYTKSWSSIHRIERKDYLHEWYLSNRNKILEKEHKQYLSNPKKKKEYYLSYYQDNILKEKKRSRIYRISNPTKELNRYSRWLKANPSKSISYAQTRRALKLLASGKGISAKQWEQIKKEYSYRCIYCGKREPEIKLTLDHIESLIKGGAHDISNAVPSCKSCNSSKQDKPLLLWLYEREQND